MSHYMKEKWLSPWIRWFGEWLIHPQPFTENYFLDDAIKIRKEVKLPLVYVGGMVSLAGIEQVLASGFEFVQIARALINDPEFINKLRSGEIDRSACRHANYCIAVMYSGKMACYQHEKELPEKWKRSFDQAK
jgi:2,4-dienoyl-CoA reductase-like NADH-dependent reductase (Old Yellow Enzyme family)